MPQNNNIIVIKIILHITTPHIFYGSIKLYYIYIILFYTIMKLSFN